MGYSYDYSNGANKLLDSKRSFLKLDYHYTTIFLAPWNPIITTLRYFGPEPHCRYTATCCVYVYVSVFVSVFVYVSVNVFVYVYVFVYVCVFVDVRFSKNLIYDIGTEILSFHCFATKILKSFCKSIILSGIESARRDLYFYSIKTWFKALWDFFSKICMRPWIRSLSKILPKRPLRDDFLVQNT